MHHLALFVLCWGLPWPVASRRPQTQSTCRLSHSVKPELYATGFEFAEGPALDDAGNLFVVNYRGLGKIGRIAPDGTASVYCDLRQSAPCRQTAVRPRPTG